MKKYYFLIIVALILGLVLTGCSLLSNIGQAPATDQSGITYLTKSGSPPNLVNLVGLWHFDEGSGTTASDSSGNGNDGTVNGAIWDDGKFGNALSFDGVNDYLDCGAAVDNSITTGITLEAWIMPALRQNGGIISNDITYSSKKGYDFFLWFAGGSCGCLYIDFGNGSTLGRASWNIPSPDWYNQWHHVAATWDGNVIKLYADESKVAEVGYSGTYSDPGKNTFIGAINYLDPAYYYFNRLIDEVRIWDTALTEEQLGSVIVAMDIKPQSCPNPLNVKNQGVLPVAILGTDDFDVNDIDPSAILLEGVPPLRWAFEDVATPSVDLIDVNAPDCSICTDGGPDGYADLTLKFDTQAVLCAIGYCATALVEEIEVTINNGDCLVLTLTGELNDGTHIMGKDVVLIIKKGK